MAAQRVYGSIKRHFGGIGNHRGRIVALFLLLGFVVSNVGIPTATVYAAEREDAHMQAALRQSAIADNPHIKPVDPERQNKPMKQNYPGPIKETVSDFVVNQNKKLAAAPMQLGNDTKTKQQPSVDEVISQSKKAADPSKRTELPEKRTATSEVFRNTDGSYTEKHYLSPKYYKKDNAWKAIDATLVEDKNAGNSGNVAGKLFGQFQSVFDSEQAFIVKENDWQARFAPSDLEGGMVRIKKGSEEIGFSPVNAKRVAPVITTKDGQQTVHYYDLWPGVNVEYTVSGGQLKENIILKDKQAEHNFRFTITGATLKADTHNKDGFKISGAFADTFKISGLSLMLNKYGPVVNGTSYRQKFSGNQLHIAIDKSYLDELPGDAFPVTIDPTVQTSSIGNNYINFKSDGQTCGAGNGCSMYAGSLQDGGGNWRNWRSFFHVPYSFMAGTDVLDAQLVLSQNTGTSGVRSFQATHAACTNSYYCPNGSLVGPPNNVDYWGTLDVTDIYRTLIINGDYAGWLALLGQDCACQSFKGFAGTYVQFTYNRRPALPAPEVPSPNPNDDVVVTTTQPAIGTSATSDPEGDPVKYAFELVSTTGGVLYRTNWGDATRITVPEGLLQDGGSYHWNFAIWDGWWSSGWHTGGKFHVDLRTGKDKTSTYEDVGPVSVSLNNGNVYTSLNSHDIKALDGSIGLNLSYNSPYASRNGLRAEYYNNQTWNGDPALRRIEATIDNDWANGSPGQNVVINDGFSAKYSGYFTAPATGTYQFGGNNDDYVRIIVNGQTQYTNGGCYNANICYDASSINLTAGQTVPLLVEYLEATGPAYTKIFVKGAVSETLLKSEWLRAAPMPTDQYTGLTGTYYADDGTHNPAGLQKIMVRQDPSINFEWGAMAPVPNVQTDNFYVHWEGYYTPPTTGTYTFGTRADDGTRVKINGQTVMDNWNSGSFQNTYDATLGDSVTTTNYGSTPELSLPTSTTVDPTGLALATTSTYETPGATDGYLRQTKKMLPGSPSTNPSFTYSYYGSTETRDDPCTTPTEAYKQAGMLKIKTEADSDGTGSQTGRAIETIYDDTGRVVATRYNTENWTCTSYDTRGRVAQTHVQEYNGNPDRTIINNYALDGNPLQTATYDENGWVITMSDLLGRATSYTDTYGDWTGYEYSATGELTRKFGDMGEELFYYDNLRRLSQHIFDGVTYATVYYDAYSRVDYIDYNNAGQMRLTMARDTLGRTNSLTYRMGNGTTTVTDLVSRSQSNQIMAGSVTSGSSTLTSSFTYDGADRLTGAIVGSNTYSYGFGAQDASCGTGSNMNLNAGKNSNRTSQTINGVMTTFCYDYADRLVSSSNTMYNNPTYDSRGNMTTIGTGSSPLNLCYDSSDRNSCLTQLDANGDGIATYYGRDVQNRLTYREHNNVTAWNWNLAGQWFYSYTGTGDTPDFIRDTNWNIIEKTLQLPGGVNLTVKPQQSGNASKQYSLPNIHGDTLLTANAAGTNTSNGNGPLNAFTYDPFGNVLPGSVLPANTASGSYGWVGQHEKLSESNLALTPIQMGARVYLPGIGRFTSVDPVEGGTENNYVYPVDGVNEFDLDGQAVWVPLIVACVKLCKYMPSAAKGIRTTAKVAAKVGKAIKNSVKWRGHELSIGKLRIAPYGNPGKLNSDGSLKKWAARLSHWHLKTEKWGGSRHRPWQTTFKRWFK